MNDHLTTNWDQVAAATGRVTSYQPNIQAIPKVPVTITGYKENYIVGRYGTLTSYHPNIQAIPKVPVTITGYKENYIVGR